VTKLKDQSFYELTTQPLNVGEIARRIVPPSCGAIVTLDGFVRQWTKGKETLYLEYEAYEPMALKEMEKLVKSAKEQFEIEHIGIVHRLGRMEIGETSVVISVAAPHRRAAFETCEWLIKELKRTVPIWKKEYYVGGEVWIQGDSQVKSEK
jgi:molybdopterin synthase catalytic subunit